MHRLDIARRVSRVALAMCGVDDVLEREQLLAHCRLELVHVERRAGDRADLSASTSASSSTTLPRAVLTRIAVGLIAASAAALIKWCVCGV